MDITQRPQTVGKLWWYDRNYDFDNSPEPLNHLADQDGWKLYCGDEYILIHIDRCGRNTKNLPKLVDALNESGIDLRSNH